MYHIKNKVQLIGTLTDTPIIENTPHKGKCVRFVLETTETTGKTETETTPHNLIGYGKVANLVEKYVKKGSEIAIEGKLTCRDSYVLNDAGAKQYVNEVEIREILLLSKDDKAEFRKKD